MFDIPFLPIEELTPEYVIGALSETMDWGLIAADIPEAHKHSKGAGVVVAVLDTGGPNHIDLNDNLLPAISVVGTVDDKVGHHTHVAGIIAALENGIGVIGVAPQAKILPIKVLDDSGHSGFDTIEKGIRLAIENKVDIINMSLGAPIEPPSSVHDAIKDAYDAGIIIIAAAGNDGGNVNWPARYDEVIAVAAMDQSGQIANFSSRGARIALGAPGVNIYSTFLNNQYALLNGTSQASPFVAGVCALILSWSRSDPNNPQIKNSQDMLKFLDELSDNNGGIATVDHIGKITYGIPNFANFMPWKSSS